jgi:hypothetical protein
MPRAYPTSMKDTHKKTYPNSATPKQKPDFQEVGFLD